LRQRRPVFKIRTTEGTNSFGREERDADALGGSYGSFVSGDKVTCPDLSIGCHAVCIRT
jgi:hypothetical protein